MENWKTNNIHINRVEDFLNFTRPLRIHCQLIMHLHLVLLLVCATLTLPYFYLAYMAGTDVKLL